MVTKKEVLELIEKAIAGQGNQVDAGGVLPGVLKSIVEFAQMPFEKSVKIEPYLYEMTFRNIDYEFGKQYMLEHYSPLGAQCTAIRNGALIGRNYDELYNNSVTIVAHVEPNGGRYGSIGLISGIPQISRELMESGGFDEALEAAPFYTSDAVNSEGLFCEINLLAREESKGLTTGTIPSVTERDKICMPMLVRYIVDHYATVDEAIDDITKYVSVYAPNTEKLDNEMHFLLADATKTVVLEFVNNEVVTREIGESTDYPAILANFYVDGVVLNPDNTITRNTSSDPQAANINGVTPYGQGIERHNIAVAGLAGATSVENMQSLMRSLFYTKAYTLDADQWLTEFVGYDLTVTSPSAEFTDILQLARNSYINRDRNEPKTWQTIHSVVYDINNKTLVVNVQEGEQSHYYSLVQNITDNRIGDLSSLETDHKSTLVEAINEIYDVIETPEMVVSMMQSNAERKVIYDLCAAHIHIAKNITFYNIDDGLYYPVSGYAMQNNILKLFTIMPNGTGLRSVLVNVAPNGTISV